MSHGKLYHGILFGKGADLPSGHVSFIAVTGDGLLPEWSGVYSVWRQEDSPN